MFCYLATGTQIFMPRTFKFLDLQICIWDKEGQAHHPNDQGAIVKYGIFNSLFAATTKNVGSSI